MNYIWAFLMIISVICAAVTGRMEQLSNSILNGASDAVSLVISTLGMMCLWTGIMEIAESSGVTLFLSKLFSPILKFLFPEYKKDSPAIKAICMNIVANLLGLGNAATPFGINAMKEMQKLNNNSQTANNSMIMFVVINTASLQLIPTFLSVLRQQHGAQNPFDILPAMWVTAIISLVTGILAAKIFEGVYKNDK